MILNVNAAEIHVEEAGEGKTIIFVHGTMMDSRLWAPQVEVLKLGFRVITYDLRGHGRSSPLPGMPFSHVADLEGIINAMGIDSAIIVGESVGGVIATNFAYEHRHRTRGLVLVSSELVGAPNDENHIRFLASLKLAVRTGGPEKATKRYMESELMKMVSRKPLARKRVEEMLSNHKWEVYMEGSPSGFKKAISRLELSELRTPALVVYGEKDIPRFIEIAKILASNIPEAGLVAIPETGHFPSLESPDYFNSKLIEFADSTR
jgi:3-oxoadipate enol-lactonase